MAKGIVELKVDEAKRKGALTFTFFIKKQGEHVGVLSAVAAVGV